MGGGPAIQTLATRRTVLGVGVGVIVLACTRPLRAGVVQPAMPELFVFEAPRSRNLVLALTAFGSQPLVERGGSPAAVRIHAGRTSWTVIEPTPAEGLSPDRSGTRIFAGTVQWSSGDARVARHVVVIETRADFVQAEEILTVWAEAFDDAGSLTRIGNPFVAAILDRDPALAARHHATAPSQDRDRLGAVVAERISDMAPDDVAYPQAYGVRLARLILPDVITYRRDRPVGLTFASQNGRHPQDDADAVVATFLTGAASPRPASGPVRLTDAFPYFPRPSAGA